MRWLYVTVLCAVLAIGLAAWAGSKWRDVDLNASTVVVHTTHGHGSGVVIGDGHYILTAKHVVADGVTSIRTSGGAEHKAEIVWQAEGGDFALLRTDDVLPAVAVNCEGAAVGDRIEIVGAPGPSGDTLFWYHSWGEVGGYYTIGGYGDMLVFSAAIYSGNSGGPAFDENGAVIGIVVAMAAVPSADLLPAPLGFNIAVPSQRICEAMAW